MSPRSLVTIRLHFAQPGPRTAHLTAKKNRRFAYFQENVKYHRKPDKYFVLYLGYLWSITGWLILNLETRMVDLGCFFFGTVKQHRLTFAQSALSRPLISWTIRQRISVQFVKCCPENANLLNVKLRWQLSGLERTGSARFGSKIWRFSNKSLGRRKNHWQKFVKNI